MTPPKMIWPALRYEDAPRAVDFLVETFGFTVSLRVPAEHDPDDVVHAELLWPEGGGVMLGSNRNRDDSDLDLPVGGGSVYVVTDHPDELFERATAAGAEVVAGLRDEDYGSRGFSVTDFEGNFSSFGTYRGA